MKGILTLWNSRGWTDLFIPPYLDPESQNIFNEHCLDASVDLWHILYIKATMVHLAVQVLKPRSQKKLIPFKSVPSDSRAQKLFKTSITHFYFFTYRVLSLDQSRSQVPTPRLQITYCVPTIKKSNSKKKLGAVRAAPSCVEPRE
jgi:hypothetical protein